MNEHISLSEAARIMGDNIIGPAELSAIDKLWLAVPDDIPDIPFSARELEEKKDDYLLVLGIGNFKDGSKVTIRALKERFGMDPDISEPCFYNQDWYDKEAFIDIPIQDGWYLIRQNVYDESRAVLPEELMKRYRFPSAVKCTYSFFAAWLSKGVKLWYHDFVWCCDTDHNGDRIYVGKYHDIDGVNKNGFSIHRHLALRNCYACID